MGVSQDHSLKFPSWNGPEPHLVGIYKENLLAIMLFHDALLFPRTIAPAGGAYRFILCISTAVHSTGLGITVIRVLTVSFLFILFFLLCVGGYLCRLLPAETPLPVLLITVALMNKIICSLNGTCYMGWRRYYEM